MILFGIIWFVRTVKAILFWTYLWQLKDYHVGRFLDHFQTEKGRSLIFNKLIVLKAGMLLFLGASLFLLFTDFPIPAESFILSMGIGSGGGLFLLYILEAARTTQDLVRKRLRLPIFTKKILLLLGINASVFIGIALLLFEFTLYVMNAIGDKVGIRGPYGNGAWPLDKYDFKTQKNLFIAVGGLGLIPLRALMLGKDDFLGKDSQVQIFYGARSPEEMLFRHEYGRWKERNIQMELTVDKECADWKGCVGLITALFDKHEVLQNSVAFLCGPPVMYKSVLAKLKKFGFADEDIYLSLERRMHCGLGVCQHCAVGSYYTCKDGPIFSYAQVKNIPGAI